MLHGNCIVPRCRAITDLSPLRVKMLRTEKCLPKGLMLSDLSCIFAILVLAYRVGFTSANLVELFDSPSLGKCFFVRPYVFLVGVGYKQMIKMNVWIYSNGAE